MSRDKTEQGSGHRWFSWIALLALMIVAMVLRLRYVREISLSVDEFNTIWAAMNVPLRGLPSFPSGNIYPHGFIFTYLVVPFVLGKFNEILAHVPGVIVSLAMLPAIYWVGRKLFDERVALLATGALAVDPDAILWGSRVRMYALLQLLTLLAVYFYYRGLANDQARDRYLAMILVVAAIFTHAEAGLLIPALGLATLVACPWRHLLRRDTILPFVVAAVGALVFFLISKYGQPGHLEVFESENRFYIGLPGDPLSGPRIFAPVFISLYRLPFSLLALAGMVFLFRPHWDRTSPSTYVYVILLSLVIPLVLLANTTWQNERYLFLSIPLLYLVAGEALRRLVDLVPLFRRSLSWQPALVAVLVPLFIGLIGTHLAYRQELGYDLAFRTLRDQVSPADGDQVVTVSPSACSVYLGQCSRFVIQHGYEEFVLSRPGDAVPVDLWTATPVLTQTAEFIDLLRTAPRVWFISDTWRFQTRYDGSFVQAVLDHMNLIYRERGVLIFRADGYQERPEPAITRDRSADFGKALSLVSFGLSTASPNSGYDLEVILNWQALEQPGVGYTAFLHLLGPDGSSVTGVDEPVLDGLYQPDFWPKDLAFADRHTLTLPPDLPPGRYRLDLGLYPSGQPDALLPVQGSDRLPLAMLTVGQVADEPPATRSDVTFGDRVRLAGYDLDCDPEAIACSLQLHWEALAPMDRDYNVFVHVVDADGNIVTQDDRPPGDPFFGTATWLPGAQVLDRHVLAAPGSAAPGEYTILAGLYYQPTNERLPAVDAAGNVLGDALPLATLAIGPESP